MSVLASSQLSPFLEWLRSLPPEERKDALDRVQEEFCVHCGYEQPSDRICQCWNDE